MAETTTMQSILALTLSFSMLTGCCLAQCEVRNQDNMGKIHLCNQLYSIFEQALVSNKDNLFVLRETFFSGEHPSPHQMIIKYHIYGNGRYIEFPVFWTEVSLFKFVSPIIFLATEPVSITTGLLVANVQTLPTTTIHLLLVLNETIETLPVIDEDVIDTLSKITTKVRR